MFSGSFSPYFLNSWINFSGVFSLEMDLAACSLFFLSYYSKKLPWVDSWSTGRERNSTQIGVSRFEMQKRVCLFWVISKEHRKRSDNRLGSIFHRYPPWSKRLIKILTVNFETFFEKVDHFFTFFLYLYNVNSVLRVHYHHFLNQIS